eukprot:SAG11_NODE_1026_length_6141_cov_13.737008_1_plen_61_part_00
MTQSLLKLMPNVLKLWPDVLPFKHRIRVIPACIILHLKLSTFFVLKLVLKVYLSKLRYFL